MKTQGYVSEIFVSFQGEGAHVGRRHLFVRLAGCNIRCSYCDTPDSLERTPDYSVWDGDFRERRANPVAADTLRETIRGLIARHDPIDAIAFTGGEPLVQADFLATLLSRFDVRVPSLLETNGMLPGKLATVLPYVAIISMDMKLPSNSGERPFWDEHAEFLRLARPKDLYVKVVVDEGTDADDVERAFRLVAEHAPEAATFMQPRTSPEGSAKIAWPTLDKLYRVARRYSKSLRVLPQTHKIIGIR